MRKLLNIIVAIALFFNLVFMGVLVQRIDGINSNVEYEVKGLKNDLDCISSNFQWDCMLLKENQSLKTQLCRSEEDLENFLNQDQKSRKCNEDLMDAYEEMVNDLTKRNKFFVESNKYLISVLYINVPDKDRDELIAGYQKIIKKHQVEIYGMGTSANNCSG